MSQDWITIKYGSTVKTNLCEGSSCRLEYPCEFTNSCSYYSITLQKGVYHFDVFGAQGGGYDGNGGKGGLSSGILKIFSPMNCFAFIGAQGSTITNGIPPATFGGGGSGYSNWKTQHVSSGGGASDIRTSVDFFSSRIIVAGGGGGGAQHDEYGNNTGGDGSGNNGKDGSGSGQIGSGAFVDKIGTNGIAGNFGFGGNSTQENKNDGCGGGGGYFGGNAGRSCAAAGGGGSGFIKRSLFKGISIGTGVRTGNGLIVITRLIIKNTVCARLYPNHTFRLSFFIIFLVYK